MMARGTRHLRLLAFLVSTLSLACLTDCVHVATKRAEVDETVGLSSKDGTSIVVDDRAGAIRRMDADGATLWLTAPAVRVRIARPANSPSYRLTLANVMAEAAVELVEPSEARSSVRIEQPEQPTRRWVDLPPTTNGGEFVLSIGDTRNLTTGSWRFGVFADVQEAVDRVGDIYAAMNALSDLRFVLATGDLTQNGTLENFDRFDRELEALRMPLFATVGNHDIGTDDSFYSRYYGRANSSFVYRGVRFTLIDDASATVDPLVLGWLRGWLDAGRDQPHVFGMHLPPVDPAGTRNGSMANRGEAANLVAMLARANVDVAFFGHVHSYYAYSHGNIPAYISGGGGAIPERMDGIGRHFLVVTADEATGRLDVARHDVGD